MRRRLFPLIVLGLALLSSCTGHSSRSSLKQAERLLWEAPDSALQLLRENAPAPTASLRFRARHALLMSIALQGTGDISASDSTARVAFDFYSRRRNPEDRMHAANCLAEAEYEEGRLTEAIVHFHEALSCAEDLKDVRMEGFICQRLGELFALNYDHEEALTYARRAASCLKLADEVLSASFSGVDEARQYLALGKVQEAELLVDSLLSENRFANPGYDYYLELLKADICCRKGEAAEALHYYKEAEASGYILPLNSLGQYLLLSEKEGFTRETDSLMRQMRSQLRTGIDSMVYNGILVERETLRGNYYDAYRYMKLFHEIQNRSFTMVISQSATRALNAYFQERYLLEQARRRSQHLLSALIMVLLLILLALSIVMLRYRRLQVEREMSRVEDLVRDIKLLQAGKKQSDSILSTLVQEKIHNMTRLTDTYFSWTDEAIHQRESRMGNIRKEEIIRQFREELMSLRSDEFFLLSIEESLNQSRDEIMRRIRYDFSGLRQGWPKFKDSDFQILILFFASFSSKSISFFMDMTDEAVRSKKKRFKQQFSALPEGAGTEYLEALNGAPH